MNNERLLDLITTLQTLPDHIKFNITNWYKQDECGTAACAMGSLVLLSSMAKKAGLAIFKELSDRYGNISYSNEQYTVYGFTAARMYFDLHTKEAADFLFHGMFYHLNPNNVTPQNVIDRVRFLMGVGEDKFLIVAKQGARSLPGGELYIEIPNIVVNDIK